VAELETVPASDTDIRLAGEQGHAYRLRRPPKLEQLGLGPRLEHDAGRAVEGSRNDELTLGLRSTIVRFFTAEGSRSLLASIDRPLPKNNTKRLHMRPSVY
jgi:hypothetical protein